jgi:hypothetical protein
MPNTQLQELARMGAQARLAALNQERDDILKIFPDLRDGARQNGAEAKAGRDRMSPEARRRQAERMRAYWAERRAQKAAAEGGPAKSSARKSSAPTAKQKGGMSAEARKAQAERMTAYWAAKRAEKQAASGEGAQAEAPAATNGSTSAKKSAKKSARKAGRKQGRK